MEIQLILEQTRLLKGKSMIWTFDSINEELREIKFTIPFIKRGRMRH